MGISGPSNRTLIQPDFFARTPQTCARELIGSRLVWGSCGGIVVETEAYDADGDPACHTFSRPSARQFVAKNSAGTAYVYLNYGVHWLLNVLVKGERSGFVLIRALEPTTGLDLMAKRRRTTRTLALCSGPGKLTQALSINGSIHCKNLGSNPEAGFHRMPGSRQVAADSRIGISSAKDFPWRFTLKDSAFVSVQVRHPASGIC